MVKEVYVVKDASSNIQGYVNAHSAEDAVCRLADACGYTSAAVMAEANGTTYTATQVEPEWLRLTYGELPTWEVFDKAWEETMGDERRFRVRNDPYMGDEEFTEGELFREVEHICARWAQGDLGIDDPAMQFASDVLYSLHIEWILGGHMAQRKRKTEVLQRAHSARPNEPRPAYVRCAGGVYEVVASDGLGRVLATCERAEDAYHIASLLGLDIPALVMWADEGREEFTRLEAEAEALRGEATALEREVTRLACALEGRRAS